MQFDLSQMRRFSQEDKLRGNTEGPATRIIVPGCRLMGSGYYLLYEVECVIICKRGVTAVNKSVTGNI